METETRTPYSETTAHRLTIAAIYTTAPELGRLYETEGMDGVNRVHDERCTSCTTPAQRMARRIMRAGRELADNCYLGDAYDVAHANNLRAIRAWSVEGDVVGLAGDGLAIDAATSVVFSDPDHEGTAWHHFTDKGQLHLECPCETAH